MTNYIVIRKSVKNTETRESEQIGHYTYGICAYTSFNGFMDIKDCVYGVSDDYNLMKSLADKLNIYDVDPIHLCDIIEDELYSVCS